MTTKTKLSFDYHQLLEELEDRPSTEDWENQDLTPDGLEIPQPSSVVGAEEEMELRITTQPSIDILNEDLGPLLAKLYAEYMLGDGAKTVQIRVESKRHGLLAFEYEYPRDGEMVDDFWDYQGPLKASVEVGFQDSPLEQPDPQLRSALEAGFRSRGYDETDKSQAPFKAQMEGLRYTYSTILKDISCNPLYVPRKRANVLSLGGDDYTAELLSLDPEVFLHW